MARKVPFLSQVTLATIEAMNSSVEAVVEPLEVPTYPLGIPEKHPLFFEKRVYQGSCGKVYPVPFIDKVYDEPEPVTYRSVRLENEYVRLVLLPEIGGRIFLGQDKANQDYDFFYRQEVIKPALVGLAGPWISGGVEFNWPQHHRPGTYLPSDFMIEEEPDGARTVWMSEHDPINRLKGMHGIRLRPGSAVVELRGRLYNRTALTHTFLWWANVAARVHDQYQSFFPEDVSYVADHAVRAMSSFPVAENDYYGVDYAARPGANDLSWYRNIPVPTSYMICETAFDFFGGYDHAAEGGFLHVADRHVAPGKKQWTWGNHEFGWAWDRELTDTGGPYIELMAGVYTDNQPDFSYLLPEETKTFTQCWWPFQKLGPVQQANQQVALRLTVDEATRQIQAGVAASENLEGLHLRLTDGDKTLCEEHVSLRPGQPWQAPPHYLTGDDLASLYLEVRQADGQLLLSHRPVPPNTQRSRELAQEPPMPAEVSTTDELYSIGEHLELYRHPTRYPKIYWEEALQRDPQNARSHLGLGKQALQRGQWAEAQHHLRACLAQWTKRHPNPESGEAHYMLGLVERYLGHDAMAQDLFAKAVWNAAWRLPGHLELAALAMRQGNGKRAEYHLAEAKAASGDNGRGIVMRALVAKSHGHLSEALELLEAWLAVDPLDVWALGEKAMLKGKEARAAFDRVTRNDAQTILDLAFDYAWCGHYPEAIQLLEHHHRTEVTAVAVPHPQQHSPMTHYTLAWLHELHGQAEAVDSILLRARTQSADYFFPCRLQEQVVLEWALGKSQDAHAAYALGNYCYDRKRHGDAMTYWKQAQEAAPTFSTVHRNLGLAAWNVSRDGKSARSSYLQALELAPKEARLVSEYAQLAAKLGDRAEDRLRFLESRQDLVQQRDDACVEWASLLNETGQPQAALDLLLGRRFHPWEGGEGKVLKQYTQACLLLGQRDLADGQAAQALQRFEAAFAPPQNLGEAYHLHQAKADVMYWQGRALRALGREEEAVARFEASASEGGDFQNMAVTAHSELSYFRGLALKELGRIEEAQQLFDDLQTYADTLREQTAKIDYFATSLPNLLVFEEDLDAAQQAQADQLAALAKKGRSELA